MMILDNSKNSKVYFVQEQGGDEYEYLADDKINLIDMLIGATNHSKNIDAEDIDESYLYVSEIDVARLMKDVAHFDDTIKFNDYRNNTIIATKADEEFRSFEEILEFIKDVIYPEKNHEFYISNYFLGE